MCVSSKELDKFYTKDDIAEQCVESLTNLFDATIKKQKIIEPSAGGGSFLRALNNNGYENVIAYDIKPEADNIKQKDFLSGEPIINDIFIGNPPFGHRSKLAIEFFLRCIEGQAKIIAFIIPITFRKWSIQSKIDENYKLILDENLKDNSFTLDGQDYDVRCCFQVWVKQNSEYDKKEFVDHRLKENPPTSLPAEFDIWQHNATSQSKKYINEDWELAVYRQGYKDYSKKFFKDRDYQEVRDIINNTNLQLFYIKPKTQEAREIIMNMDFEELAKRNLSTPGFGKRDFIQYYLELKAKRKEE